MRTKLAWALCFVAATVSAGVAVAGTWASEGRAAQTVMVGALARTAPGMLVGVDFQPLRGARTTLVDASSVVCVPANERTFTYSLLGARSAVRASASFLEFFGLSASASTARDYVAARAEVLTEKCSVATDAVLATQVDPAAAWYLDELWLGRAAYVVWTANTEDIGAGLEAKLADRSGAFRADFSTFDAEGKTLLRGFNGSIDAEDVVGTRREGLMVKLANSGGGAPVALWGKFRPVPKSSVAAVAKRTLTFSLEDVSVDEPGYRCGSDFPVEWTLTISCRSAGVPASRAAVRRVATWRFGGGGAESGRVTVPSATGSTTFSADPGSEFTCTIGGEFSSWCAMDYLMSSNPPPSGHGALPDWSFEEPIRVPNKSDMSSGAFSASSDDQSYSGHWIIDVE